LTRTSPAAPEPDERDTDDASTTTSLETRPSSATAVVQGPSGARDNVAFPSDPEGGPLSLSSEIAALLESNESGLALIYRVLESIVIEHDLDDAALVLDEASVGPQVFRARRRPLSPEDEALLQAGPGLYTEPPLSPEAIDRSMVSTVCTLALRLDMLRYDSWHDPLTGLYDRRSFDRLLEMAVARSTRYGWPFTLVLLDCDDLKETNDRFGHAEGDALLRDLAERLRRVLRFGDNAARIGGDEFALILPDTEPDDVPLLAERVEHAPGFHRPSPRFSFGAARCPEDAKDMESLFRIADSRLFDDKQRRKVGR
jgi:diguanylate cyclase (GGDEF)-like protein